MKKIRIKASFVEFYRDKLDFITKNSDVDYYLKMMVGVSEIIKQEYHQIGRQLYRTENNKNEYKDYYGKNNVEFKNIYLICG